MHDDFRRVFAGRKILVTGDTGFKGGWLCLWLARLGAHVKGIGLPPPAGPSFFHDVRLDQLIDHRDGDIRSPESFAQAVGGYDPEILIHMAAQSLVRPSYEAPLDTLETNVMGTAVVLDAARTMPSLQAAIVVTSDKCYENREWAWPYRETDPMGGADPYSASKGCTEIVAASYRRSFFSKTNSARIATVRAGNVFGGGDWAVDRLVPDIVRSTLSRRPVMIRNPKSVRPWQHVLEPVSGYLTLIARLLDPQTGADFARGWNFGPEPGAFIDVETIARGLVHAWGDGASELVLGSAPEGPHEAGMLTLDSSMARIQLGWKPRLSADEAVTMTANWYRAYAGKELDMRAFSLAQIEEYMGGTALPSGQEAEDGRLKCA